ncbi:MAG TPA: helix-turn-helix transcriptional regulator [Trebonia sp.]
MPNERRPSGSPTVRRRELGAMLRALRNERGLTVDQVAGELLCSPSKVSRMETGHRGATLRDIRDLCDLYEVTGAADRERLMTLAREGKQQGWWQSFSLPYTTYVGLEQEASSLATFQSAVVPGLFQVADYIRAIHRAGIPRLEDEAIEERVEERGKRQQILTGAGAPRVEAFLDEAVFRRPVGAPAVMRRQLSRLIEISERPNVTIQVIPFSVGAHPALESNFTILEFAGRAPTIVHTESLAGPLYLERDQDIERYMLALDLLRGLALDPEASAQLIAKIRDAYPSR